MITFQLIDGMCAYMGEAVFKLMNGVCACMCVNDGGSFSSAGDICGVCVFACISGCLRVYPGGVFQLMYAVFAYK